MFTLRPTQKLLTRMKMNAAEELPASTNLLGDWYAKHVVVNRRHLVVCCAARTFLPLIVEARDLPHLVPRMTSALADVLLLGLGIDRRAVDLEVAQMKDVALAKTASRQVLGVLNEYAWFASSIDPGESLVGAAAHFAHTPLFASTPNVVWPDEATRQLFSHPLHLVH